jgi:LemA protein
VKALKYIFSIFIALFAMIYFEQCSSKPKTANNDSLNYNALTKSELAVKKTWGDVEAQYQRRTDLYSSVIGVIKIEAKFEKSTISEVMEASAIASQIKVDINDPSSLAKFQAAQSQLQASFIKLIAVAEAYPDLQTTKAFQDFQTQIEGTENRINLSRRDFNQAVVKFNTLLKETKSKSKDDFSEFKEMGFLNADISNQAPPRFSIQ